MENITVLSEWSGNSMDGSNVVLIVFGILLAICAIGSGIYLVYESDTPGIGILLGIVFMLICTIALTDCLTNKGIQFQKIQTPNSVSQQELLEYYDTAETCEYDSPIDGYTYWKVSFKQVD